MIERLYILVLNNEYCCGIYVEKIIGELFFLLSIKFNFGCGWLSFLELIFKDIVKYLDDILYNMFRIEVRLG